MVPPITFVYKLYKKQGIKQWLIQPPFVWNTLCQGLWFCSVNFTGISSSIFSVFLPVPLYALKLPASLICLRTYSSAGPGFQDSITLYAFTVFLVYKFSVCFFKFHVFFFSNLTWTWTEIIKQSCHKFQIWPLLSTSTITPHLSIAIVPVF